MSDLLVIVLELVLKKKIAGKSVLNTVANMMTVLTGLTRHVLTGVIRKVENLQNLIRITT